MSKVYDVVRKELLTIESADCCDRAFLSGAIRGAGELSFTMKGFALTLRHPDKELVEKLRSIVERMSGEEFVVEETYIDINIQKGVTYTLSVPAETAVGVLEECEIVRSRCELVTKLPSTIVGKKCCKKAYLRGLFLSCGYLGVPDQISDWHGGKSRCGYSMEFKLNSDIVLAPIKKLLEKSAYLEKNTVSVRNRGSAIYIKKADAISRVLVAMGSNQGVLSLQEIITERQMKNDINRANNFDLANIDKSISASERQIEEIKYIDMVIGIDSLPPTLADTCKLRLLYPTVGLEELGKLADPPISKSCINHRLRKISAIRAEL